MTKIYPVIDDEPARVYDELEKAHFSYVELQPNRMVDPGTGTCATLEELKDLRFAVVSLFRQFGFGMRKIADEDKGLLDKKLGELLMEKMDISYSVAATLEMWQFLNLRLLPDIVFWRWGPSRDHFYSARRNYCGTQWQRFYLFCPNNDTSLYFSLKEAEIAELYERSSTRGLPNHVFDVMTWFRVFSGNGNQVNDRRIFREVIKLYNAELAYRLFFALPPKERRRLFNRCYKRVEESFKRVKELR